MKIAITTFCLDRTVHPVRLAQEVEARGFESLWYPEHSHIPSSRETPWPGSRDGEPLPDDYWRMHDQFNALAMAGAVTTTLRLGTSVTLIGQRDPIWTAKQVASLDHLTGGRVEFGIGFGWNREEQENHGIPWTDRRAMVREKVLAMQALWTQDEASFAGEHVRFAPAWALPKPVQRPHPPIHLGGGWGPKLFAAIVEYGDGWMPISARNTIAGRITPLPRGGGASWARSGVDRGERVRRDDRPGRADSAGRRGRDTGRADAALRGRRRRAAAAGRMDAAGRAIRGGRVTLDGLRGRVAVITGGASGIGRALAERFATAGARLVLADVEEPALAAAGADLRAAGAEVAEVVTDVADPGAVDALADAAYQRFGAVHVVCNNAGVVSTGPSWEQSIEDWQWVLGVDLWGVIHGVRSFVPRMLDGGEPGHIVNTASIAGLLPFPNIAPYDVAKAGVVALSEALHGELRAAGAAIGVSVLCPGVVPTRISESSRNRPGRGAARAARHRHPAQPAADRADAGADRRAGPRRHRRGSLLGRHPRAVPGVDHPPRRGDPRRHRGRHPSRPLIVGGQSNVQPSSATISSIGPRSAGRKSSPRNGATGISPTWVTWSGMPSTAAASRSCTRCSDVYTLP